MSRERTKRKGTPLFQSSPGMINPAHTKENAMGVGKVVTCAAMPLALPGPTVFGMALPKSGKTE